MEQISVKNKTYIITGASRGIGRETALYLARHGANVVIASKTTTPHEKLPGTVFSVAEEAEKVGGKALAMGVDVRLEEQVQKMIDDTVAKFGGIDGVINNAGAISLTSTEVTTMKRFDLMHQVNTRAVFMVSKLAYPYLKKSKNPHVVNLSPPLSLDAKWYKHHLAYSLSKFGMSLCTLGFAEEWKSDGIAVNSLWPKYIIETAATQMLMGKQGAHESYKPELMALAIYEILTTPSREFTGNHLLDHVFLKERGHKNLDSFLSHPHARPLADLFVE